MKKFRHLITGFYSLIFILISSVVFGQTIPEISSEDAYYKINNYSEVIDSEYMIVSSDRAATNKTSTVIFAENPLLTEVVSFISNPNVNPFIKQPINSSNLKWDIVKTGTDAHTIRNVENQSYLEIYNILGSLNLGLSTSLGNSNDMRWDLRDNNIKNKGRNRYLYLDGTQFKTKSSTAIVDLYKKFKLDNFEDMSGYEGDEYTFDSNALPNEGGGNITYQIIYQSDPNNENAFLSPTNNKQITFVKAGIIQVKATVAASGHIPSYSKIITITIYSTVTCFIETFENFTNNSLNFPTVENGSIVNETSTSYVKSLRLPSNGSLKSKKLDEISGTVNVELSIVGYSNSNDNNKKPKVRLSIIKSDNTIFSTGEIVLQRRSSNNNNVTSNDFKNVSYPFINVPIGSYLKVETVNSNGTILWLQNIQIQCTEPEETIWQYQRWSKGKPNQNSKAIIRENINQNVIAKDLKIETDLIVPKGNYFRIYNVLDVNFKNLTFEKGAYLYLDKTVTNVINGDVGFKTEITSYMYSSRIFSSPVFDPANGFIPQLVKGDISSGAFSIPQVNLFKVEKVGGWIDYTSNNFIKGRSVAIRRNVGPKFNSNDSNPLAPELVAGELRGLPFSNNATITVESNGVYTVGNPYTAPLNIYKFLNDNKDIVKNILLWRDDNPYDFKIRNYRYPNEYWIECSLSGCTNYLQYENLDVGLGFLIETLNFSGEKNVKFNKTQKTLIQSGVVQNNRTPVTTSRYIISFNQQDKEFKSLLISYIDGATHEYDENYDYELGNQTSNNISSIINERKYSIDSRAYPIDETDKVNLRLQIIEPGDFQIKLKDLDGEFSNYLSIYLKDNVTNTITNLSEVGSYFFSSEEGIFNDRFEITYKTDYLNNNEIKHLEDLKLYKNNDGIFVTSNVKIKSYKIFDFSGKLTFTSHNIFKNSYKLSDNSHSLCIYLFELEDGRLVYKKYYN